MLGKLIKYDFLAIGRLLLPLYAALIAVSLLLGITVRMNLQNGVAVLIIIYTLIITAGMVMTAYLLVERFYHNLLGNEGYLMFALPVTTADHIVEKLLSALIWTAIGIVAVLLSGICLALTAAPWSDLMKGFSEFFRMISNGEIRGEDVGQILEILAVLAAGMVAFLAKVYCSIAVGHLWREHRILGSILAFIGFSILEVWVSIGAGRAGIITGYLLDTGFNFWLSAGQCLILAAVYSAGTWFILDRHLNLE